MGKDTLCIPLAFLPEPTVSSQPMPWAIAMDRTRQPAGRTADCLGQHQQHGLTSSTKDAARTAEPGNRE